MAGRPGQRLRDHHGRRPARSRTNQALQDIRDVLEAKLGSMGAWTRNAQTQAEVEASILDWLYGALPRPPFTVEETMGLAHRVYDYVWQQSDAGKLFAA